VDWNLVYLECYFSLLSLFFFCSFQFFFHSCIFICLTRADDNDPSPPAIHPLYWNAAAGYYAYVVAKLSVMGYDVLGQSQLAGSPPIPQWDIPDVCLPFFLIYLTLLYF
jgi:hypothetical protein